MDKGGDGERREGSKRRGRRRCMEVVTLGIGREKKS